MASLLTLIIVAFHVINMRAAGGLWRDEAAAVHLAGMSSVGAIWAHLEHESFPLLFTMLLRAWSGIGSSDVALRVFGLLVGLAVVAALWCSSRLLGKRPPLLALLLIGFSPTMIRWGDSLRAYGIGVLFILLTFGAVWAVMESRSRWRVVLAMLTGLLAVQSLYQNAFMLAAICLGGVVVAARRRDLKGVGVAVAIGIPAALSLLPYRGVIARASEWNVATQVPIDLARIWLVLHRALNDRGPLLLWLWGVLAVGALLAGVVLIAARKQQVPNDRDADAACFVLVTAFAAATAYYGFLKVMRFPSEVWYYLVGMAITAVAIDALLARGLRGGWFPAFRLLVVAVAVALSIPATTKAVRMRMTNLDVVAQRLNEVVSSEDLVVVHPWFCGASLSRYYRGRAGLTTLPPLADIHLQRLDLFKEQMKLAAPIEPVLAQMETTLRAGHTVFLVGYYPFGNPPRPPPPLPRAGEGPEGWRAAPYMTAYGMEVAYALQFHAVRIERVEVPLDQPVNPFENFPLTSVRGWR